MYHNEVIRNYKGEWVKLDDELIKNISLRFHILLKKELNRTVTYWELLDTVRKVYEIIDQYSEAVSKYSPCKRGCSTCCNMLVVPSKPEVDLIYYYLINNFDLIRIQNFENQIKNTLKYIPKREEILMKSKDSFKAFNRYYLKQQKCAFLSKDGDCEIYPVRPFACRSFYVISDASQCKPNSEKMFVEYKLRIIEEMQYLIERLNNKVQSAVGEGILGFAPIQEHFRFGINDLSTSFTKISKIEFDL